MKNILFLWILMFCLISCQSKKIDNSKNTAITDTIKIANEELEYEVIIIDAGFASWMATNGKPRGFYSQNFLEARNRFWVLEWNNRFRRQNNGNIVYDMPIDYDSSINYGYEVNYMLYHYLLYFQLTNNTSFGGFAPRL